ncbi:MAG TPA: FABP family protein [Jatrophihabitans sp.]|uniref:FABP family protein n=1 Tax=Jatrophihabitans sp. TaxID=1932789 RepID=UPI002EE402DF
MSQPPPAAGSPRHTAPGATASEATAAVPEPADTTDLRAGPEINPALLAVLGLVGRWSGFGNGLKPGTGEEFRYAQRVSFAHDGRPFLSYESRTWLLNPDGSVLRPAFRENGFLRMGSGQDELELVLATAVGIVEVFTGLAGDSRWELATAGVGFTRSAKQVAGERRLYALSGEQLMYAQELALTEGDYRPHLNASLTRD